MVAYVELVNDCDIFTTFRIGECLRLRAACDIIKRSCDSSRAHRLLVVRPTREARVVAV